MSPRRSRIHIGTALLAASLLLAPSLIYAQGTAGQAGEEKAAPQGKAVAPRKAPASKTPPAAKRSSSASHQTHASHATPKRKRPLSARQQRARLHLEPDRTQEIQRALIQAGYLHEEATGRWDESTRDAMRRYQADHGFPVTGLPEAKSLMKLGLGPHPLPPEVDSGVRAQANASEPPKDTPSTSPPPPSHPPDTGPPPRE